MSLSFGCVPTSQERGAPTVGTNMPATAVDIDGLLDSLTIEEQVSLLSGADFWTTVPVERLGIPAIKVTDGPNGARGGGGLVGGLSAAAFPVGISLGSTFDP